MSVVKLQSTDGPVSGSGMDRAVEKKGLSRRAKFGIGGGASAVVIAALIWIAPFGVSSQSVSSDRLTISTVTDGTFDDFIPLRGRVTPSLTIFLDAVEGGRVEKLLVEDGAGVAKGQLLAVMSNAELQLNVLARETEVTQQINDMRTQELALERNRIATKGSLVDAEYQLSRMKRQVDRDGALAANGWVSKKALGDSQDEYRFQKNRFDLARESKDTDERLQASQLKQIRSSSTQLQTSLAVARANLDSLNVRAPVAGQLSAWSLQVGQSMNRGERLGQIDSPGRNKLTAGVDEFYLGRVVVGQTATLELGGKSYALRVSKIPNREKWRVRCRSGVHQR